MYTVPRIIKKIGNGHFDTLDTNKNYVYMFFDNNSKDLTVQNSAAGLLDPAQVSEALIHPIGHMGDSTGEGREEPG